MELPFSLKEMKNVQSFEIEQAIYIPSTDHDTPIASDKLKARIIEVKKVLTKLFGGYTTFGGAGGYYSKKLKDVIEEDVIKVISFAKRDKYEKNKERLYKKLKNWGKKWHQESIGYETEGDLYYIESN